MKRKVLYKTRSVTPYKWAAYILLFAFIFSNLAIYYSSIQTYAKQQTHQLKDDSLFAFEELAEEDGIDSHDYFSDFFLFESVSFRQQLFALLILPQHQYRIFYIQNVPLFIRNRVLRL